LVAEAGEVMVGYAIGSTVTAEGDVAGETVEGDGNVHGDSEVGNKEDMGCYVGQIYWWVQGDCQVAFG
jgi:hypothetical protein